jgi:hypothetical protein
VLFHSNAIQKSMLDLYNTLIETISSIAKLKQYKAIQKQNKKIKHSKVKPNETLSRTLKLHAPQQQDQ